MENPFPTSEAMLFAMVDMGLMDVDEPESDDPHIALNELGLQTVLASLGYLWALLETHLENEDDVDSAVESMAYQQGLSKAMEIAVVLYKAIQL